MAQASCLHPSEIPWSDPWSFRNKERTRIERHRRPFGSFCGAGGETWPIKGWIQVPSSSRSKDADLRTSLRTFRSIDVPKCRRAFALQLIRDNLRQPWTISAPHYGVFVRSTAIGDAFFLTILHARVRSALFSLSRFLSLAISAETHQTRKRQTEHEEWCTLKINGPPLRCKIQSFRRAVLWSISRNIYFRFRPWYLKRMFTLLKRDALQLLPRNNEFRILERIVNDLDITCAELKRQRIYDKKILCELNWKFFIVLAHKKEVIPRCLHLQDSSS